jgi:hypothetical protein
MEWRSVAGQRGYLLPDANLDLQSTNADKNDLWLINSGYTCQIPQ